MVVGEEDLVGATVTVKPRGGGRKLVRWRRMAGNSSRGQFRIFGSSADHVVITRNARDTRGQ